MLGIVLAAGEGHRLRPLTMHRPKPTLPWLPHRSIFDGAVALLADARMARIACNVHYLGIEMAAHATASPFAPLGIYAETYMRGPAGSLLTFEDELREAGGALVVSGDVSYEGSLAGLRRAHFSSGALLTIGLTYSRDGSRFGVFETDRSGRVVSYMEKPPSYRGRPAWVSAGIYAVAPALLDLLDRDRPNDFLVDLLPRISLDTDLCLHRLEGTWSDLGTATDYRAGLLRSVSIHGSSASKSQESRVWVAPGGYFSPDASALGNVYVAAAARVESGAVVRDSVLLEHAVLQSGQLLTEGILAVT